MYTKIESKIDKAIYKHYCHHWSADYISPHIPTILAMSILTLFTNINEDFAVQVAGSIIGENLQIVDDNFITPQILGETSLITQDGS